MDSEIGSIESTRVIVRSAYDIPAEGFGNLEAALMVGSSVRTEKITRAYQLTCGCIVTAHSEIGSTCQYCRDENLLQYGYVLTPLQIEWASKPCRNCQRVCQIPGCNLICCPRHSVELPNGEICCIAHYNQYVRQKDNQQHGIMRASGKRFWLSLFADPKGFE